MTDPAKTASSRSPFGADLALLAGVASLQRWAPSRGRGAALRQFPTIRGPSATIPARTRCAQHTTHQAHRRMRPPQATVPAARRHPTAQKETMTLTTIDPTPALVVIDMQKGIVAAHKDGCVTGAVQHSAELAAAFRGYPALTLSCVTSVSHRSFSPACPPVQASNRPRARPPTTATTSFSPPTPSPTPTLRRTATASASSSPNLGKPPPPTKSSTCCSDAVTLLGRLLKNRTGETLATWNLRTCTAPKCSARRTAEVGRAVAAVA